MVSIMHTNSHIILMDMIDGMALKCKPNFMLHVKDRK